METRLKERARVLGFELAGIAPARPADDFDHLCAWLDQGFEGDMDYMRRHAEARRHPAAILPEVRSVVMVGMNYKPASPGQATAGAAANAAVAPRAILQPLAADCQRLAGKVSRYALGEDYHEVLRCRLGQLLDWLGHEAPGCRGRIIVDTAPLLERDFARRAGLGWIGKNTMLLNKRLGSFFFLGALLLDLELAPDKAHETSHCGSCTACLTACPTQAFVQPGQLDARRCISYLTIELRGAIPEALREPMGEWIFGCDICQDVCPWNRKSPLGAEPALRPRPELEAIDLVELLGLSEEEFRRRFRGTALMRTKRRGLLRNAAIVLGNRGDRRALPALERALTDPEPVIRAAAQWAIERIDSQGRPFTP